MTRLLAMTIVIVAMIANAPARAQETVASGSPATVSYPDQWGWVLPVPEGMEYVGITPDVWIDSENRVVVAYSSARGEPPYEAKTYRFYDLFAGRVLTELKYPSPMPLPQPDRRYEDYVEATGLREVPQFDFPPQFRLADGSYLRMTSTRFTNCDAPIDRFVEKVDAAGAVLWRRMLIRVSALALPHVIGCVPRLPVHSQSFFGSVHPLPDGTFLFAPADWPFVIRFHDDFVSPYVDASDELLVLDPAEVEPLLDEADELAGNNLADLETREEFLFIDGYMTARLLPLLQAKLEKANGK